MATGYRERSMALLTDLYQLTMAAGYLRCGKADDEAVFNLFYRKNPFDGGFALAGGLDPAVEAVLGMRFGDDEVSYLRSLKGGDGTPLFDSAVLDYFREFRFACDIDAVPEGTVVFPNEPILRVTGPIVHAQIVESLLLNILNFQTLIATKAARICYAARGEPVLEFGLRRAHGVDGALAASRAAYLGGCAATSNVQAGSSFGIPVRGTHAHSWVMTFAGEAEAFDAYADALPGNVVLLVDTYDTVEGVRRAIETGRRLRERGHELTGIRLDSGDLAALSIEARRMLDEAGFTKTAIVASNDLDETIIASLKEQGARINVWGVGTRLVTAFDEPALGGVYKLAAYRPARGQWRDTVKVSEQPAKTSIPGVLQVRRFSDGGRFQADMIFDERMPSSKPVTIIDQFDATNRWTVPARLNHEDLLAPVIRRGRLEVAMPTLEASRSRAQDQLNRLPIGVRRFLNPHLYTVGLERSLHEKRTALILEARGTGVAGHSEEKK